MKTRLALSVAFVLFSLLASMQIATRNHAPVLAQHGPPGLPPPCPPECGVSKKLPIAKPLPK